MKKMLSFLLSIGIASAVLPGALPMENTAYAADFSSQLNQMISDNMRDYISELKFTIGSSSYSVDGSSQSLSGNAAPKIINDSTMLPVRAVAEALGGSADFNSATGDITIKKDDTTLVMRNGEKSVEVDMGGQTDTVNTNVAPTIEQGTTLVPVRLVSETLGANVRWNGKQRTVTVTPDYQTKRIIVQSENNRKIDFSIFNPKKVIDNGRGLYIVQFKTNIGDAKIKQYCEQINNKENVRAADPDLVMEVTGSNSPFSGIDTMTHTNLKQYAEEIKDKDLRKVNIGIIEFGRYVNNSAFSNAVDMSNAIGGTENDQNHAMLDTAIIDYGMRNIGTDKYSLKCYTTSSGESAESFFTSQLVSTLDDICKTDDLDIINVSLATSHMDPDNVSILSEKIKECRNILFVCAAGNHASETYMLNCELGVYPAAFAYSHDNVMSIAATDANDEPYSRSNYAVLVGSEINSISVAAPGVEVSAYNVGSDSGTSQAAPHVTVAAAMLKAQYGYSASEIKSQLMSGRYTVPVKNDGGKYYGVGTLRMPVSNDNQTVTPSPVTPPPTVSANPEINDMQPVAYEFSGSDNIDMEIGKTASVKLYARYSDGRKTDITDSVTWSSTNPSVATVSNGIIQSHSAGKTRINIMLAVSASTSMPTPITVNVRETQTTENETDSIVKYELSSDNYIDMKVGDIQNISVYAVYSSGRREDVTQSVALKSTDNAVVTVNSSGRLKAVGAGKANISMSIAASASVSLPKPITVNVKAEEITITEYEWSDDFFDLESGETDNVKLYAVYSDGSRKDVTSSAGLSSTNEGVAKITSSGKITAIGAGTTRISMNMAVSASVSLPKPVTVTVTAPQQNTVMYGDVTQDGKINNKDVNALQKALNGSSSLSAAQKEAADVDGDDNVTDSDLNLIKKYVMGIISSFPAE